MIIVRIVRLSVRTCLALFKTKKDFLQNVEKNGDEFYRNKFPNWDEIKNAMITMADEQVKSLRAQKKISGEYYSKNKK